MARHLSWVAASGARLRIATQITLRGLTWLIVVSLLVQGCAKDSVTDPSASDPDTNEDNGGSGDGLPAAPSDLAIIASCAGLVLSWQDNSSNEEGFRIYRLHIGVQTEARLYATLGANATSHTDRAVDPENIYLYQVRSYNSAGDSRRFVFDSETAIGPPRAPGNLAVTYISESLVRLTWVSLSSNVTGFEIRQRSKRCDRPLEDWTAWTPVLSVGPGESSALVSVASQLLYGYYFSVYARNACGYSTISNQARAGSCSSPGWIAPHDDADRAGRATASVHVRE